MRSKLNWTAITCCTIRWRTRKSTWTKSSHCWPQSTTHSVNQWRVRPAKENSSSKWRKSSPPSGKTRIRFGFSFENLSTIFFFLFNNSHFFFFRACGFLFRFISDREADRNVDGETPRSGPLPWPVCRRGAPIPRHAQGHQPRESQV